MSNSEEVFPNAHHAGCLRMSDGPAKGVHLSISFFRS